MNKKLFAIRDVKLSVYNLPFHSPTEIEAVRTIQMAMMREEIQIATFPEDYELYEIAEFDTVTGKIKSYDSPKFIVALVHVKAMVEKKKEIEKQAAAEIEKTEANLMKK